MTSPKTPIGLVQVFGSVLVHASSAEIITCLPDVGCDQPNVAALPDEKYIPPKAQGNRVWLMLLPSH